MASPIYDRLALRWWPFIPLWGLSSWFGLRRGAWSVPGTEWWWNVCPGTRGKATVTTAMMGL